jgi:AcrR family transcriptional regulator
MTRSRLTAEERYDQVVAAAVKAFAEGGYKGTTTDQVARLAGVSQPYVVRLFGGKQKLFVAALQRACGRVEQHFREVAGREPTLKAMGEAYADLLAEREVIVVLLHGFAAASDPALGPVVRELFGRIYTTARELTGADAGEAGEFMATGMLLTVLGAMNVIGPGAVPPAGWSADLLATFR